MHTQYVCSRAAVDTQREGEELEIISVNMKHISSETGGNDTWRSGWTSWVGFRSTSKPEKNRRNGCCRAVLIYFYIKFNELLPAMASSIITLISASVFFFGLKWHFSHIWTGYSCSHQAGHMHRVTETGVILNLSAEQCTVYEISSLLDLRLREEIC